MSASSGYGTGGVVPPGPSIETLTGNVGGPVGPDGSFNINVIGAGGVLVTGNPGTNTLTITAPGETSLYTEDTGTATPSAGNLNVFGGASTAGINIHTHGDGGNTVTVILNDSLLFPNTNNTGTQGVLFWNGDRFLHNYDGGGAHNNVFLGSLAGNLTLGSDATANTGIGAAALNALVGGAANLGAGNTAVGNSSMAQLTIGSFNSSFGDAGFSLVSGNGNVILGHNCGNNLVSGNTNVLIGGDDNLAGFATGLNYTSNESSNIVIQNTGVIGDNNTIRIGTDGSGDAEQNACYVAGIYNRTFASPSGVVQIDHNFKLGSSAGTNGQLLIGSTGASPAWANLTSTGGTVVITNLPNSINLEASGTPGGASTFPCDIGTATEALGVLNVFGGSSTAGINMITTGLGNTVSVILKDSLFFPNTDVTGAQGVLFWGGNRFIHNRGSDNTFIGKNAGNLTLTTGSAIDNAIVGASTLSAVTTAASNSIIGSNAATALTTGTGNTAAGFAVLDNLVSGDANIALGVLAGTNYTGSESNNILLNNFGVVGESNTIRIGRSGVQTDAYMAGVFGASIGTTNAPVFIDNTGKLGTLEGGTPLDGSSFLAVVSPFEILSATNSVVGTFFVGAQSPMTVVYDNFSGAFFPGTGVGFPATFTAPISGFYQFTATFILRPTSSGSSINSIININGSQYMTMIPVVFAGSGGNKTLGSSVTGYAQLAAGDAVTFSAFVSANITNPPFGFDGNSGVAPFSPYKTCVMGTLLKTAP